MNDYWKTHHFRDCARDKAPKDWCCIGVINHGGPCAAKPTGINRLIQWIRLR